MNHWNHRVLLNSQNGESWYEIHEVHYEDGKPTSWTAFGVPPYGQTKECITFCMQSMTRAMMEPVLKIVGDRLEETEERLWPIREELCEKK